MENAIKVVMACCVLHNILQDKERSTVETEPQNPHQRVQFMDLRSTAWIMTSQFDQLADFFVPLEGEVSWQD